MMLISSRRRNCGNGGKRRSAGEPFSKRCVKRGSFRGGERKGWAALHSAAVSTVWGWGGTLYRLGLAEAVENPLGWRGEGGVASCCQSVRSDLSGSAASRPGCFPPKMTTGMVPKWLEW